ncbi:hypothetical protein K488DRAFT_71422 [Vararia minispora EC-137]|uniref:Uncharacterized protein n=1 Tax=Vararia minispora EC-137 TaxID=1314806 RepID=A0ACB8QIC4_9AGAM|nr:hypothetical protein K488DRAFT_71422 [Vararia minispora EC-137]
MHNKIHADFGGTRAISVLRLSSIRVIDDFEPINGYTVTLTLPSDNDIVAQCRKANIANLSANIRGVAVANEAGQRFWVKFGTDISLAEARTQHYVARWGPTHESNPGSLVWEIFSRVRVGGTNRVV